MITEIQAAASIGTFVVFVISAIVALRQFRSSSRSNQLAGLQAVSVHYNSASFERWFNFVLKELPAKMMAADFRDSLRDNPIDRDVHLELRLANWYEEVGILAKYGIVNEEPLFEYLRRGPETAWQAMATTIAIYREFWGSSYYRNFERLAKRSTAFYNRQAFHRDN